MTSEIRCSVLRPVSSDPSIGARGSVPITTLLVAAFLLPVLSGCPADNQPGGPQGTLDLVVDLKDFQPSLGALYPT